MISCLTFSWSRRKFKVIDGMYRVEALRLLPPRRKRPNAKFPLSCKPTYRRPLPPELLAYAASVANATASSIVPTVYIDVLDGTMSWRIIYQMFKNEPLLEIRNYYHNVNWNGAKEYFLV
jgi:hypothetical protein